MVGTADGSKSSTLAASNGTQTRPANTSSVCITEIPEISFKYQTNATK